MSGVHPWSPLVQVTRSVRRRSPPPSPAPRSSPSRTCSRVRQPHRRAGRSGPRSSPWAARDPAPAGLDDAGLDEHLRGVLALSEHGQIAHFRLHGAIAMALGELAFTRRDVLSGMRRKSSTCSSGPPRCPRRRPAPWSVSPRSPGSDQLVTGFDPDATEEALRAQRAAARAAAVRLLAEKSPAERNRFDRALNRAPAAPPVREDNEFFTTSAPFAASPPRRTGDRAATHRPRTTRPRR